MSFYRDLFTGKLRKRPASEPGIIATIASDIPGSKRTGSPWWKDNHCPAMDLMPEHATPERIAKENAAARKHGTGAEYSPEGKCYLPTRRSRFREMGRRTHDCGAKFQDNDAGFSDRAG